VRWVLVTVRNESTQIPKAQFAATFGVSEAQLERYFQQGMPHEKKGRRIMIPMPEGRVWYHKYLVEKGRREAMPQDLDEAKKRREMAMAEIAFVSDIRGVCSSRDTFWIT